MSGTDNYEFLKSSAPQDVSNYTPYNRKDWNYVNDINNGVYTNNSMSLVQFDLSSIYNSSKFVDISDLYCVLPITIVSAFTAANVIQAPSTVLASAVASLKTNHINLIHQADLVVGGKVIEQTQPYINKFVDFKMMSEMSAADLKTLGPSLGFASELDNPNSVQWVTNTTSPMVAVAGYSGVGVCNNRPFTSAAASANSFPTKLVAGQNNINTVVNTALSQKCSTRYVDSVAAAAVTLQNVYGPGGLMNASQLSNEFKPYYTLLATNYIVYYDACVIRLKDLFDSVANWGLSKRFDGIVRLYVNTGTIEVDVVNTVPTTGLGYYSNITKSTFTNSCPITVNYLPEVIANGGLPTVGTNRITSGLYLARAPATSNQGVNMATSGASHPMQCARMYYSQVELKPSVAEKYIQENRSKKIVYRSVLTNTANAIGSGSSWSQLVQSGVTNPSSVIIMPFVDTSVPSSGQFGPGGSPFDTNLAHPLSLTNLQVSVGGVNQLNNSMFFTYEEFLTQVNLFEQLTSSDLGISCGLMSREFWEMNRVYCVNVSRGNDADKNTPRNINVSFNNNTNVAISVLIFIIYYDELSLDVETGLVKK